MTKTFSKSSNLQMMKLIIDEQVRQESILLENQQKLADIKTRLDAIEHAQILQGKKKNKHQKLHEKRH